MLTENPCWRSSFACIRDNRPAASTTAPSIITVKVPKKYGSTIAAAPSKIKTTAVNLVDVTFDPLETTRRAGTGKAVCHGRWRIKHQAISRKRRALT
jgi:hypothetical protein